MYFTIENHRIVPRDRVMGAGVGEDGDDRGPNARLVLAWEVARDMMDMVPPRIAWHRSERVLVTACDILNSIAAGDVSVNDGILRLETERDTLLRTCQSRFRAEAFLTGLKEAALTGLLSGAAFAFGDIIYSMDLVRNSEMATFWTDVENAIYACAWALSGFAVAVFFRRLYFVTFEPFRKLRDWTELEWKPWRLALLNFLLVALAIGSIFAGMEIFANFDAFGLIASPWTSFTPGLVLGLAAPRVLVALMDR